MSVPDIPAVAKLAAAPLALVAGPATPTAQAPRLEGDRLVAGAQPVATHQDGQLSARDGASIAYRSSVPAQAPKAIVVMQQGTYGQPEFFDGMGEALAQRGVLSYALGSRVEASDNTLHADDLNRVVAMAKAKHPGVPLVVMGVSLGAAIALDWSATHNPEQLPVVALSPVVVPRYLGPRDLVRIAGGLLSDRAAERRVHSPMSAGKALTTNPQSPEAKLEKPEGMTVPARLFGDVTKMTSRVALAGHRMRGPLLVAMAGDDQVATNLSTRGFMKLVRSKDETVRSFPGLAHDLSQEWHDPSFVGALGDWVLAHTQPKP